MAPGKTHVELTEMARTWLFNRAAQHRGAFELNVADYNNVTFDNDVACYSADFVAVAVLQYRQNIELMMNAHRDFQGEATDSKHWIPHGISNQKGFKHGYWAQRVLSHVFECKASRADFLSTFSQKRTGKMHGNRMEPVADFHWIVTDKNVIVQKEVPTFWGWLERRGVGLTVKRWPHIQPFCLERTNRIGMAILFKSPFAAWNAQYIKQQLDDAMEDNRRLRNKIAELTQIADP